MNLFVGNLGPETTEQNLSDAFSEFGKVLSVKIIIDPQTGMPKGFGFVEMEERRDGYEAIVNLDMTYLQGTIISVKEAKNNRQQGGGNRFGGGGGNRPQQRRFSGDRSGGYGQGGGYGGERRGNYNSDRSGNYNSDRPVYSRRPNYDGNDYNNNNSGNY